MFASLAAAALAQDGKELVLDEATEPQVLDLTGKDTRLSVPLDGSVDLSAFVLATPEGEVALDEVMAKAGEYLDVKLEEVQITSVDTTPDPPKPFCITVFGVRVCAPS